MQKFILIISLLCFSLAGMAQSKQSGNAPTQGQSMGKNVQQKTPEQLKKEQEEKDKAEKKKIEQEKKEKKEKKKKKKEKKERKEK
ncbi:MAG: hypothetical protein ACK4ON_10470, partial [Bacteroidia bacterium]